MLALPVSIVLGVIFFFGLKFFVSKVNSSTTSEATEKIPLINQKIKSIDTATVQALEYAEELIPFDEAIERQEKEAVMKAELNKQLSTLSNIESKLSDLKLEVEETEKEYNEIKKGKESAQEVSDNIKSKKDSLKSENLALQNSIKEVFDALKSFTSTTKLNPNQEAGFKLITENVQLANKQLESLVASYNQSSGRFQNLHDQFNDLEVEFSKLVEKELSD